MAFSNAQKVAIRSYLGYPNVHKQSNPRLEGAIIAVEGDVDASASVVAVLTELASIDTKITSAFTSAGLKSVGRGAVEWYGDGAEITSKRNEGRAQCSRLSIIFGVPLAGDYYGVIGYAGDGWASWANQYGGWY